MKSGTHAASTTPLADRFWFFPFILVLAGFWAYSNSFSGAFLLDDPRSILENAQLHRLFDFGNIVRGTTRPFVNLSFALNYAFGGPYAWSYHVVNLAIHMGAALVLYGIVRRTLARATLSSGSRLPKDCLALCIALLWLVHPLQTQSVTYISQRAESLMGLFYLLTLYGFIRGLDSSEGRAWKTLALVSCALGMACKPVMATAPLIVLLYDRVFVGGSMRKMIWERGGLHAGLFGTWIILALILAFPNESRATAGLGIREFTPRSYALTQCEVVAHYLKLSIWPRPLCLDYQWPAVETWRAILPSLGIMGVLGLGTLGALRFKPWLGFLGAWFLLILAPSSSVIPLADAAFEHRMYLPLAAPITLGVLTGYGALRRLFPARLAAGMAWGGMAALVVFCVHGVRQRNEAYRTTYAMWSDVVKQRPHNPRAHVNLGIALDERGDQAGAISHYTEAIRLRPDYAEAHSMLGTVLDERGDRKGAIRHYLRALEIQPNHLQTLNNLGNLMRSLRRLEDAQKCYERVLEVHPNSVEAHHNLGLVLCEQGKGPEAIRHFEAALQLRPDLEATRRVLEMIQNPHRKQ